jgi:hypothetical protein
MKKTYSFLIGKRKFNFQSKTSGGAYDQAVRYQKKNYPRLGKPVAV